MAQINRLTARHCPLHRLPCTTRPGPNPFITLMADDITPILILVPHFPVKDICGYEGTAHVMLLISPINVRWHQETLPCLSVPELSEIYSSLTRAAVLKTVYTEMVYTEMCTEMVCTEMVYTEMCTDMVCTGMVYTEMCTEMVCTEMVYTEMCNEMCTEMVYNEMCTEVCTEMCTEMVYTAMDIHRFNNSI
ncbi:hypothetical protein Btru_052955 [Bulinus truncatus]|nr:hypothetical protein Btru_052955 [Bulinus truncatus]